ncbi:OmpA family protein [Marinomonas sp. MED121]|uniref:OmpA family protein n=1 Tax=Marinomonas sp. MED121 TaxID=314277 RepID=UPI0000690C33|nr:OmpA family protein [Marinomonas sp. MED121]EAQ64945.1 OmpA family protein [Marinomonas sp. MED121]
MFRFGFAILLVSLFSFAEITVAESLYGNKTRQDHLKDDDKDGVINIRDKCSHTPLNAAVDHYGCHASNTKLLSVELNILFVSNRFEVRRRYYSEVKKLADFLRKNPSSNVVIEGHTDNTGHNHHNQQLSQQRAQAIANILIKTFSIAQSRVKAIGYGETRPIASNLSAQGKAKNRRVVAEVFARDTVDINKWDIYSVDRSH